MRVEFTVEVGVDLSALPPDLLDAMIDQCYSLADFPRRYPLVPRFEHLGLRRCPYRRYLIFYRVREQIEIIRVLHGASDYESLLFPDQ